MKHNTPSSTEPWGKVDTNTPKEGDFQAVTKVFPAL